MLHDYYCYMQIYFDSLSSCIDMDVTTYQIKWVYIYHPELIQGAVIFNILAWCIPSVSYYYLLHAAQYRIELQPKVRLLTCMRPSENTNHARIHNFFFPRTRFERDFLFVCHFKSNFTMRMNNLISSIRLNFPEEGVEGMDPPPPLIPCMIAIWIFVLHVPSMSMLVSMTC